MRKTLAIAALLTLVLGAATAAAGEKKLDGKELYKTSCKACHGPDAEAGEYAPMFLIQEQWQRFFDEDYVETHQGLTVAPDDTTKVLDAITPPVLDAIREFCIECAADSEHPMTCG